MKKRILALLLLAVMIVSALPLTVLPVLAAEEEEIVYEEKDYNALYVQDGLAFAADFFRTNQYWNPDGATDYTVPVAPLRQTAYWHDANGNGEKDDGEVFDFTNADVRTAAQTAGTAAKAAYDVAFAAWKTEYLNYMQSFMWMPESKKGFTFTLYTSTKAEDFVKNMEPIFATNEGYVQFFEGHHTNGGMTFTGAPTTSNEATAQLLMEFQDNSTRYKAVPNIFYNIRLQIDKYDYEKTYRINGNAGSSALVFTAPQDYNTVIGVESPITLTQSIKLVPGADLDTYTLSTQNGKLFSVEGDYNKGAESLNASTYVGWSDSFKDLRVYGYRSYTKQLSDAEIAQNHFADLAKYFKVDLTVLALLSPADMAGVYAAVNGFTFKSDRAAVVSAIEAAALAAVEAKYAGVSPDYIAVAVRYGLDISLLLELPASFLPATCAFLESVTESSTGVKAGYEAAIAADVKAISDGATLAYADYNGLFVQDGLTVGIDYYGSNAYWGMNINSAIDPTYLWQWGTGGVLVMKADAGTISGGALHLSKDVQLGETHKLNNYSQGGMTTEFLIHDSDVGGGTILNIDDVRFSAAKVATHKITALGQRAFYTEEFYRLPGETETYTNNGVATETYKAYKPTVEYPYLDAIRTYVFQNKAPTYTQDYYSYFYKTVKESYQKENVEFVLPTDAQVAGFSTTQAKLLAGGQTYFYVTHDAEGNALAAANVKRVQFAFYKPIYTVIDGKAYITGSDCRIANYGEGLGENGKDYFHTETGSLKLTVDDITLYNANNLIYADNKGITGGTYLLYSYKDADSAYINRDVYAYRSYSRILTEDELIQNHFVDIAKYYKLNLAGFDTLAAEDKAVVYAAVSGMRLGEVSRDDAQLAVTAAIHKGIGKAYDAMKGDDATINAFIDFAAEYYIDIDAILTSERDMSSVFAASFTGSREEMQEKVDEAYLDAWQYLSYQRAGYGEYNDMLSWFGANVNGDERLDIEGLMALPMVDRLAFVDGYGEDITNAATVADMQAIVDAFVSEAMKKYERAAVEYDYDALYAAQINALISLDFFKTNEYWNETVEMPIPCEEVDGYEYNGVTYNFKSNPADRFHTADEKWAVKRSDGNYVYFTKAGGIECAKGKNPTKVLSANIEGQFVAPRQMFATKAEAEEVMAAAVAKWSKYTFEIVEIPRYIVYRVELTYNNRTYAYAKNASGADAWNTPNGTIGFKTEQLADDKAKALAGEGATAHADGGYVSADGKYWYHADVRPMQSNEYYQLMSDYALAVNNMVASFNNGAAATTINFNQQMPTIGEIDYQSKDGEHFYSHVAFKDGAMVIDPHNSAPYFTVNNIPQTGDIYVDMILAGGATSNAAANFFSIRGVKYQFSIDGNGTKLVKLTNHSAGIGADVAAKDNLVAGRDTAFRLTVASTVADKTLTLNTFIDGAEVIDSTALAFDGAGDGLLAHSQYATPVFYTYRIYNRILTEAEQAQNAFADLAKWYKLDVGLYLTLSDEDKAKVWADMADYRIDDLSRAEVQVALSAAVAKYAYAGVSIFADAEKNADFLALAAIGSLDLSAVKMLTADARAAFCEKVLMNDFHPAYATNADVIYTIFSDAAYALSAMTFAGYQVRLDSGASFANYAGVRAVFDIDEARIATLIEKNGGAVTLTIGATGLAFAGYTITYTMENGELVAEGADIYDRADGKSVNVLVTYKGDEITKENLTAEYSFSYTITVGDTTTAFAVDSTLFGDSVSAAEVYGYFYENGYATDRVVAQVINLCAE